MSITDKVVKASPKKWVMGCGAMGLFLAVLGGLGLLQVFDFPVVAMRADKVEAEYRAAGLPWVASDMEFESSPGVDEDFLRKLSRPGMSSLGIDGLPDGNRKETDWVIVAEELERIAPQLKDFERIARAERVYIPREWDDGVWMPVPDALVLKNAGRRFCNRAELRARGGDLEGAFEDLRLANGLARVCGQQPVTILHLVGVAIYSISCRSALKIAEMRKNDARWVERVREELEGWDVLFDYDALVRGETYSYLAAARNVRQVHWLERIRDPDLSWEFQRAGLREGVGKGFWRKAIVTRQMEFNLARLRAREAEPENAFFAELKFAEYGDDVNESRKASWAMIQDNLFYGESGQFGMAIESGQIQPQMAALALRAWELRMERGRYPTDLSELGVEIVIDPSVGEPVLMTVDQDAILVYHRGRNQLDEGGLRRKGGVDDLGVWFPKQPSPFLDEPEMGDR